MTHSDVGLEPVKRALEKSELDAILASGTFDRAPNLEHLLTYVCGKYFAGAVNEIKEYSIAVDALGRPADFDQKRDSIVRVEAHRLRKRLRDYYEAEGASHAIRIEIPPGQYAPRFVPHNVAPPEPVEVAAVPEPTGPSQPEPIAETTEGAAPAAIAGHSGGHRTLFLGIAIAILLCTSAAAIYYAGPGVSARQPGAVVAAGVTAPGKGQVLVLAGLPGGQYSDRSGRVWESDRYFTGGSVFDTGDHPILGTREPRLFQTRREGDFSYDIPLAPGVYELRLYFAETLYGENNAAGGGETTRLFDVYINGTRVLHDFDVIGEAGASAADVRAFKDVAPAADGKLHLRFEKDTNPAFINAIEITPGTYGKLRPVRIVSRDHAYTDSQGRTWQPDRYVQGGQLVVRSQPVVTAGDSELFHGERFGNLRYVIPVPPGRYGVTLYFAEEWFGPGTPAGGGVGSRTFDILSNGLLLRRAFDIFKEAGGNHRAVSFTSHGLEPDCAGQARNFAASGA